MAATVLVVDDEPRVLELYASWLGAEYDVRTANDGETALELVDETVDVVLLDRRMPGLSGDEVLARIRGQGLEPWVVMVTAVDPSVDAVDLGFDDYLLKPVEREDLFDAVEAMLGRDDHDETLRTYFETLAKLGMLEATHTRHELGESDEYARLKSEHIQAKRDLSDAVEDVRTDADFESLFVELPQERPDAGDGDGSAA